VLITDFIQDVRGSKITAKPPATTNVSAAGIEIVLLVATPKPEYLAELRMSPAELYQVVLNQWAQFFRDMGADKISVRVLDAVPTRTSS
jgi:hypothetical protein